MKLKRRLLAIALAAALLIPAAGTSLTAAAETIEQEYVVLSEDAYYLNDVVGGFDLNGHNVVVMGDFYQTLPLNLNGGELIVHGNFYNQGAALNVSGGQLCVEGDFFHNNETTLSENGLLQVGGNMALGNMQLDVSGGTLHVGGDFVQNRTFRLNGGTVIVDGVYHHRKGMLSLGGGRLETKGGYYMRGDTTEKDGVTVFEAADATLNMTQTEDYFLCGEMFWFQSCWGSGSSYNELSNGTLELTGDFRQCSEGADSYSFSAHGDHRVRFSGEGAQTVRFDSGSSGFHILEDGGNGEVDIIGGYIDTVDGEATIHSFVQYGSLDLNGNDLIVTGDMTENGNVTLSEGTLTVGGDYLQQDGVLLLSGGELSVGGSYRLQSLQKDPETGEDVYTVSQGVLKMNDPDDLFTVYGDFYTQSQWGSGSGYNHLVDGTLELYGNFSELSKDTYGDNFNASGNHKVKFVGDGRQVVHFDNTDSGFGILMDGGNGDVAVTNGRFLQLGEDAALASFVQYGAYDGSGHTLTVSGEVVESGNITLNGGQMLVGSDWIQKSGTLDLNGGRLEVDGDYRLQNRFLDETGKTVCGKSDGVLKMNDAEDYFLVKGDFYTHSQWGSGTNYNHLVNGTLELYGDFSEISEDTYGDNFNASGNHKVKFAGNGRQVVHFESTASGFSILMDGGNGDVAVTKGRFLQLGEDAALESFVQYGTYDGNGHSLTVSGEVVESGNITLNGGQMLVGSDWIQKSGTLDLNGGRLEVDGDYRLQNRFLDETGKTVCGKSDGVLKMNNAEDYFLVKGDFYTQSQWGSGSGYNHLVDGTLELYGDFSQISKDTYGDNFNASGNHKVKFAGNGRQIVHFESTASGFGILMDGGNGDVAVTNGRFLKLGEDTSLASFVQYGDYDGNGHVLTVSGEVVESGNISLNGGQMLVGSDWIQKSGTLDLNKGRIEVDGDYRLQNRSLDETGKTVYSKSRGILKMNEAEDYFLAKGDFYTQSQWGSGSGYNHLVDGTMELQGDFVQISSGGGDGSNFNASANHRVLFTGGFHQNISFESPAYSGFALLMEGSNQDVDILSGRVSSVVGAVTLNSFNQFSSLDISGQNLTVTGKMVQNGDITLNGGTLSVEGDYLHQSGRLSFNKGTLTVDGDYRCQKEGKDEEGRTVYQYSEGVIRMADAEDCFLVRGDFTTQSRWGSGSSYNYLVAGTLELQGDFNQITSNGGDGSNFAASSQHRVRLTGGEQKIVFESKNSSGFNILTRTHNEGASVSGQIKSVEGEAVIGSFEQYGTLNLGGASLYVTDDMTECGKVDLGGGTLTVGGNYCQPSGTLDLNNGTLRVEGDYRLQSISGEDYEGHRVYGDSGGCLQMNQHNDRFIVGGDFFTQSTWGMGTSYNALSDGVLQIGGGFVQLNGSGSNFSASGSHVTVFTGSEIPLICFDSGSSGFRYVVFEKLTLEDVLEQNGFRYGQAGDSRTILNLSYISADRIVIGGSFTASCCVYGGKPPYQMSVYAKKAGDEEFTLLQSNTAEERVNLTPNEVGDYTIRIRVTDANGVTAEQNCPLTVANVLTNTSSLQSASVAPTEKIVVNCSADGGSGQYEYEVSIRETSVTAFTKVRDYSAAPTVTIEKPEGSYEVMVRVKDSFGKVVKKKMSVKVEDRFEVGMNLSAETIELGGSITVQAECTGGTPPVTVAVFYRSSKETSWKTLKPMSEETTAVLTPTEAGQYEIYLKAKDSTGRVTTLKKTVTVTKPVVVGLVNNSTVSAETVLAGKTVTVNCAADGGTGPYTYGVYYKKSSGSAYTTVQSYSSNTVVSVKLSSVAAYDILVKVKDSKGKIVKKTFAVNAVRSVSNISTVSSSEIKLGERVTLTGAAQNGIAPYSFAYYYKKASSSSWTTLKSYSSKTSVTLKPGAAVAYDVMIKVKDASGTIVKKTFTLSVSK